MKTNEWKNDFNSILSCHEVYDLEKDRFYLEESIKDLREIHPEITDNEIRSYLKDQYKD